MRPALLSLLVLAAVAAPAGAHGGAYRGPWGMIPPGSHDPEPPRPPSPPERPGGPRIRPMGPENWLFRWHLEKDAILAEVPLVEPGDGLSGEMIREAVHPALETVASNRKIHPDIRAGALLALARSPAGAESAPLLLRVAREGDDQIVIESALLGLGLLPRIDETARRALLDVVGDAGSPVRVRCFAMAALGLLRDRSEETFAALAGRLAEDGADEDLPASALYAIGLIGDPARSETLVRWFSEGAVEERVLTDAERAWVLWALGRIGHPTGLAAVRTGLGDESDDVRRFAAVAMGWLVPALAAERQAAEAERLARFHGREDDLLAKNHALLALARAAADDRASGAVRALGRKFGLHVLAEGDRVRERPFAALALARIGRGGPDAATLADAIRPGLARLRGDKVALGAPALALGLLGDRTEETRELLLRILRDRGMEKKLRGAAAVALGMTGGEEARSALLASLAEREHRDLRVDTALAAGLLGGPDAVPALMRVLRDPKASQFVLGSAAISFGRLGDDGTARELLRILEPDEPNGEYPDLTRALVAVALGRMADARGTERLARLSDGFPLPPLSIVPSLAELLTIL